MKNIYTLSIMSAVCILSLSAQVSDAASFSPVSRTYYPAGNTQPIRIINNNNNANNNVNNNTSTAPAPTYTATAPTPRIAPTYTRPNADVHDIAQNNLPTHTDTYARTRTVRAKAPVAVPTVTRTRTTCGSCNSTSQVSTQRTSTRTQQTSQGSTLAAASTSTTTMTTVPNPTCSLVPALTASGAIELQWTTAGATVAYIDGGIGHVSTMQGKKLITPSKDTAYNLTVLNDAGIAGTCGAKVTVSMGQGNTLNVTADTTGKYTYTLDSNGQRVRMSDTSNDTNNTQDTAINTPNTGSTTTTDTDSDVLDTESEEDAEEVEEAGEGSTSFFGDAFKKVAVPVGIVFLILIVLLVVIMSKVKAAK